MVVCAMIVSDTPAGIGIKARNSGRAFELNQNKSGRLRSVAFERREPVYGDDADCPDLSAALHARARPRSQPSGTERMVQQARIPQGAMLFVRGRLCCQRC